MKAAVLKGDAKKLAELIRQDPGFNVNMELSVGAGWTPLHYACDGSRASAVIPLLLAHPDIDVNLKNIMGETPFYLAFASGSPSYVREMLKDSRVKLNEPGKDGCTPLRDGAYFSQLDVIKWWIASERDMDLGTPGHIYHTDAIGGAKDNHNTEVATLLETQE